MQREFDALRRLEEKLLVERGEWIEQHRDKMAKQAGVVADRSQAEYATAVAELAQVRQRLESARQAEVWARTFGTHAASETVPSALLAAGLAAPLKRTLDTRGRATDVTRHSREW